MLTVESFVVMSYCDSPGCGCRHSSGVVEHEVDATEPNAVAKAAEAYRRLGRYPRTALVAHFRDWRRESAVLTERVEAAQ